MLFSIGVESPKNENEAFGLIVPALCNDEYGCFSAADSEQEIAAMVTEAIGLIVEDMIEAGASALEIVDKGVMSYRKVEDYAHCDLWLLLEVDLSAYEGKPKRINISLPDVLIQRIDNQVKSSAGLYRDRSHFLAVAAKNEMRL